MGDFLVLIADRIRHKVFKVLSINATKHMVVITIATQTSQKELLEKWLDEDYWVDRGGGLNLPSEPVDKEENENLNG